MAINYEWKITALKKAPSLDGLSDVITHINFEYKGTKGSGSDKIEAVFNGACPVGPPDSNDFKEFAKLMMDSRHQGDFSDSSTTTGTEHWIRTEEDSEMLMARIQTIQAQLGEKTHYGQMSQQHYNLALAEIEELITPKVIDNSEHVFHQYTLRVLNGKRDDFKIYLKDFGIPSMIYYPIPIHKQKPYRNDQVLQNTDILSKEVISLPIHTELENSNQDFIIEKIIKYFK